MNALDDNLHQDLASLSRRDPVEFGRMSEEMHDPFDEALESRIGWIKSVELESRSVDELAETHRGHISIRAHQFQQRGGDRRPHIGLSVWGTNAGEDDDLTAREP